MEPIDVRKLLQLPPEHTLVGQDRQPGDEGIARRLRPREWDEYVGHDREKTLVRRLLGAAREREEVADHVLLHGPPGLGKTAMADLIQEQVGRIQKMLSSFTGPQAQSSLVSLRNGDSLFIDEVHGLKPAAMESVQIAMEGGVVGWNRRAQPFTLIAATTKYGKLPLTLRDRFGLTIQLQYYPEQEISQILKKSAEKLDMTMRPTAVTEIAIRSRGVPRIANRLLRRVRDVSDEPRPRQVKETLIELGVDSWGFDDGDRGIIMLMFARFQGGPVGVRTLAAASGHEERTLTEAFEPYLLRKGVLDIVPRGRQLTQKGFEYCQQVNRFLN